MDEDILLRDLLSSAASSVVEDTLTEITLEDLNKAMKMMCREPRECSCGNGFHVQYQVSTPGCIYDDMCVKCFQELTKDNQIVWVGE